MKKFDTSYQTVSKPKLLVQPYKNAGKISLLSFKIFFMESWQVPLVK